MVGYIVLLVGESCSLEQMISRVFGKDDLGQYGLTWLKNNFLGDILEDRYINIDLDRKCPKTNSGASYVQENELQKYRYIHPYMYKRKLTNEVIYLFDIGYDKDTDCITFPIRDVDGNCLFVARRSVKGKYFNYPSKAEKPVYGLYELELLWDKNNEYPQEVYICESMIDALTLWGIGKYAVALNGLGTKQQIEELNKLPCRKFILATDNDLAGYRAREKLRKLIKNHIVTEIKIPHNKKDINDCTKEEIENLKEIW